MPVDTPDTETDHGPTATAAPSIVPPYRRERDLVANATTEHLIGLLDTDR